MTKLETPCLCVSVVSFGHLPLLVRERTGYQNLCRLVTRMKARGPKNCDPSIIAAILDDLRKYADGLICLTGDERGPLAGALKEGGYQAAHNAVQTLIEIYGHDNVYVELQRHFDREEEALNQAAISIARELQLPLIATNGVAYAVPERRRDPRCLHLHSSSHHARRSRTLARAEIPNVI